MTYAALLPTFSRPRSRQSPAFGQRPVAWRSRKPAATAAAMAARTARRVSRATSGEGSTDRRQRSWHSGSLRGGRGRVRRRRSAASAWRSSVRAGGTANVLGSLRRAFFVPSPPSHLGWGSGERRRNRRLRALIASPKAQTVASSPLSPPPPCGLRWGKVGVAPCNAAKELGFMRPHLAFRGGGKWGKRGDGSVLPVLTAGGRGPTFQREFSTPTPPYI